MDPVSRSHCLSLHITNATSTFLDPEWAWQKKFNPFKDMGSDIFIIAAPGHNSVFVADPEAITQITTRRNDFPKPIEIYGSVDIFGKNVVSTEGSIWRQHRKITSPPFTEKNNHLVWLESLHQGKSMLTSWTFGADENTKSLADIAADTMRLSLHVISRAGFGERLLWPHEEVGKQELINGHTMSYKDALSTLLEYILAVMLLPRWILGRWKASRNQRLIVSANLFIQSTLLSRAQKSPTNPMSTGSSTWRKCIKQRRLK